MAPTQHGRPLRFATSNQLAKTPPSPTHVPPGRVLIVRGRSRSDVYHTWTDCPFLRGVTRLVKTGAIPALQLRPCSGCTKAHQLTLTTEPCCYDAECREPALVKNKAGRMCRDHARIFATIELTNAQAAHSQHELESRYGVHA